MSNGAFAQLHVRDNDDNRRLLEARDRGFLQGVAVELADGSQHPVVFWDPVRLAQDLEEDTKHGHPFIAEKGMIVVNEVTLEAMMVAVKALVEEGFFSR